MESAVKKIAVLTSGGDAPGMNAAIRAVARAAHHLDIECVGVRRGYNGLISGDFINLDNGYTSGLMGRGGTVLYSSRSKDFMTDEGREKAAKVCRDLGIEGMVGIGGDGTFKGLLEFSNCGISVVGIPATIDNDIACSTYTIGYDTACNTALECIDKLRDTMQSHERCSIVEVMGRRAGHLALRVGMACGATVVLVPEKPYDFKRDVMDTISEARQAGRTHFTVIIAEGVGATYQIAEQLRQRGLETRVTVLGHIQRGGSPSSRDRIAATNMGYEAVRILAEGKTNRVICEKGEQYVDYDIHEALAMTKGLDERSYGVLRALTGARAD